ncbi:MAG: cobyrinate a,c-diamide synthase [Rhizobiales bacterium]|nr:cobyrinate a,c-diamide synthase [Hyphomicrobiales bacterium]NRB13585.1 cobyrinate a,c-diamide synthase [Hyphomicrobiales bacterium]
MGTALVIAATHSGAGKSLITMALLRAFKQRGLNMAVAKTGPDYIDPAFHAKAINSVCYNFDLWAMNDDSLNMVEQHLARADMAIIEGVLGLFDGPVKGIGSTADVAKRLNLPVILVVDAGAMGQSVAALIQGFVNFRSDIEVAGIIFNNIGSARHEKMLRAAVKPLNLEVFGCLARHNDMLLPARHLGLKQADEMVNFDGFIDRAANYIKQHIDLDSLASKAKPCLTKSKATVNKLNKKSALQPLGQKIAIAKDAAFAFCYPHILQKWRDMGAELSFFSPLDNEMPNLAADAVYLPGGYPELFAPQLASKFELGARLRQMAKADKLIYGECGGYMCMGEALVDKKGVAHKMFGLLDLVTSFEKPKRHLGYRQLSHNSALPWASELNGHEFHYTHALKAVGEALFSATDAEAVGQPDMGLKNGRIMGSYAHVIDVASDND